MEPFCRDEFEIGGASSGVQLPGQGPDGIMARVPPCGNKTPSAGSLREARLNSDVYGIARRR
jgi:hypothetical protein